MSAFTRTQFLQAAGALALAGRRIHAVRAPSPGANLQHFTSRPDLKPPAFSVVTGSTRDTILLAPSSGPGQRGAMIADGHANLVWFHPTDPKSVMDFKVQTLHGKPVLTWWEGKSPGGVPHGEWVVVDATYRELARFGPARGRNGDLHEFVISAQNTALVACTEVIPWRNGHIVGGVVQELELRAARLIWEWRSLEHVPPQETELQCATRPALRLLPRQLDRRRARWQLVVSRPQHLGGIQGRAPQRARALAAGRQAQRLRARPRREIRWQHDVRRHGPAT